MRISEYLTETNTVKISSFEKLRKDYSEILKIYKECKHGMGGALYRASNRSVTFAKRIPRKNRKPLDTPLLIQKFIDELFYKKFGWNPRSEGVFTINDAKVSIPYGRYLYIVFPKNGFKFVYSPSIDDLFAELSNNIGSDNMEEYQTGKYTKLFLEHKKIIEEMISTYKDSDLLNFLNSNDVAEIVLKCSEYYLLLYDGKNEEMFLNFLRTV